MFVTRHAIASSSPDYNSVSFVGGEGAVACRLKMYAIGSFPRSATACLRRYYKLVVFCRGRDRCMSVIRHATTSVAHDCNSVVFASGE